MKKLILMLFALLMLVGCSGKPTQTEKPKEVEEKVEKTNVLVTTSFLYDMAKSVAGDLVDIKVVIPAGEDPHTYEPKPEVRV